MSRAAELIRRSRVVHCSIDGVIDDYRAISVFKNVMVLLSHPKEILIVIHQLRLLATLLRVTFLMAAVAHGIVGSGYLVHLLEDFNTTGVNDGEIVVIESVATAIDPRFHSLIVSERSSLPDTFHLRM